jgi:Replication-relaxation
MSKLILQPRDLKLLNLLNRFSLMSTKQIQNIVFNGIADSTMLRRMRLLEKNKYICQSAILDNYSRTWQLSDRAADVVENANVFKIYNRNTINHDILITEVRLKLENFALGKEWINGFDIKATVSKDQNAFRKEHQLVPDGVMIAAMKNQHIAIAVELELTIKSKNRYLNLLENYDNNPRINFVWYIFKSVSEARAFDKILTDVRRKNKIWMSLLDDVLKNDDFVIYSIGERRNYSLSTISFDEYKIPAHPDDLGVSNLNESDKAGENNSKPLDSKEILENELGGGSASLDPDHTPPT